jgi:hypothetical protein
VSRKQLTGFGHLQICAHSFAVSNSLAQTTAKQRAGLHKHEEYDLMMMIVEMVE